MAVYSKSGILEIPMRASERLGGSRCDEIEVFACGLTIAFEGGRFVGCPLDAGCLPAPANEFYQRERIEWKKKWDALPVEARKKIRRFGCRLSKSLAESPRKIGF